MSDPAPSPPLDLTPIRARWTEITDNAVVAFARQDVSALFAEVDRLRAECGQLRQERDEQEAVALAAIEQSKQFDARLAAIRALPEQWRKENGDYPESKLDCAADLDAAINQK